VPAAVAYSHRRTTADQPVPQWTVARQLVAHADTWDVWQLEAVVVIAAESVPSYDDGHTEAIPRRKKS